MRDAAKLDSEEGWNLFVERESANLHFPIDRYVRIDTERLLEEEAIAIALQNIRDPSRFLVQNFHETDNHLEVVSPLNEGYHVIGMATYDVIHREGFRHRSVQVLVYNSEGQILVVERSGEQKVSAHKYHPSVGGHVRPGQSYLEAAQSETNKELFNSQGLPTCLELEGVTRYTNDTRETNHENTALFRGRFDGQFNPDTREVETTMWKDIDEVKGSIANNPRWYTTTFKNVMSQL
jgi:isopentenyl-diphosphate Delta-isomerase